MTYHAWIGKRSRRAFAARVLLSGVVAGGVALVAVVSTKGPPASDFRATYDTEANGQVPADWKAVEYAGICNDGKPGLRERVRYVSSDPAPRQGAQSVEIRVAPGDRYCASTGERTLLRWLDNNGANGSFEREGDDFYYGWSYYLPADWVDPALWSWITEWHADARFRQAPVKVGVRNGRLILGMDTGQQLRQGSWAYNEQWVIPDGYRLGHWVDVVMHVAWRKAATGAVEIWTRRTGIDDDFVERLNLQNVPTLVWLAGQDDSEIYVLQGLYRNPSNFTSVLYLDNFNRATTLEAIEGTFTADPEALGKAPGQSPPAPAVAAATFGNDLPGASWSEAGANLKWCSPATLPRNGTVSKLSAYLGGAGTTGTETFRGLIYSDVAGSPGTLEGTAGSVSIAYTDPAQAWDFVFAKPLPLTAATYWLCLQSTGTSAAVRAYWVEKPNAGVYTSDAYSDGPSQSFGTVSPEDHQNSIFATYT